MALEGDVSACRQCGDCCRYLLLPLGPDREDYYAWVRLHGLKVVVHQGRPHARIDLPCKALEGDRCLLHAAKPLMCALAPCMKGLAGGK